MSSKFDSYQKRRLQSSYISVVVSIALVLFMVGVLGLILLKSTKVANHVKEKVAITLFIKDKVTQKQIKSFRESLLEEIFTKKAIYTSKTQAAKKYSKEIGEDFLEFLGSNPLKNGIDIYLKADFVTPEKIKVQYNHEIKHHMVNTILFSKCQQQSTYEIAHNVKSTQLTDDKKQEIQGKDKTAHQVKRYHLTPEQKQDIQIKNTTAHQIKRAQLTPESKQMILSNDTRPHQEHRSLLPPEIKQVIQSENTKHEYTWDVI